MDIPTLLAALSIIVGVPGAILSVLILRKELQHTHVPPPDNQPDKEAA